MNTPPFPPNDTPDALMLPRPFRGITQDIEFLVRDTFSRLMNLPSGKAYVFPKVTENLFFVANSPQETIYYPKGHALVSQPRYHWYKVAETDAQPFGQPVPVRDCHLFPKAVLFGWRRNAEEEGATPSTLHQIEAHAEAWQDKMRSQHEHYARYNQLVRQAHRAETVRDVAPLTDKERQEVTALEKALNLSPTPATPTAPPMIHLT